MTKEEHDILIENNRLLKSIIQYIQIKENNSYLQEFIMNVAANSISN